VAIHDKGTGNRFEVVLKTYENRISAEEEFNNLSELNHYFKRFGRRYAVPIPFAVLPDVPGLLMSRVLGYPLARILWPFLSRYKHYNISDDVKKAGRWLAKYHMMSPHSGHRHKLDFQSLIDGARSILSISRRGNLRSSSADKIEEWLVAADDIASRLCLNCVPICSSHFTPEHVFVSETDTSVVDFEVKKCGWQSSDLADFASYIELRRTVPQVLREQLTYAFLKGYASEISFETPHRLAFEVAFLFRLLEACVVSRTNLNPVSRTQRMFLRWHSWSAANRIRERTRGASWKTISEISLDGLRPSRAL